MSLVGILIIGKIPPPVGGVTIHVQRLLHLLKINNVNYSFVDLRSFKIQELFNKILKSKVVHIHVSNVFFQFFLIFIAFCLGKKSIITFHGDLNRFSGLKKIFSFVNIKFTTIPIMINVSSYEKAIQINKRAVLMSVFIPPINEDKLNRDILSKLTTLSKKYKNIFATNGSALNYDKDGVEIYGIIDLVNYFNSLPVESSSCLVISDPSGDYGNYFSSNNINIRDNILLISEPHSYFEVLKISHANIRNTSTDGDSISIRESLYLNKPTFVTNVVSRPEGSILYKRGEYRFVELIQSVELTAKSKDLQIFEKLSIIYS